jgi:hypothetical protein
MGQLRFPPHVKADDCPACGGFVPRPAPCCADEQLHVLKVFNDGKSGEKKLLLECSDCGKQLVEAPS